MSVGIGLALVICGCASSAIGLALMKKSSETESHLPLWRRVRWIGGFVFLVVNATVLDLIAYGMVPLALIAPFAGLTMVFSLALAASGLIHSRERLTVKHALGAMLVISGVTLASTFGPHVSTNVDSMAAILGYFESTGFIAFSSLTLVTVGIYLAVLHVKSLSRWKPSPTSKLTTVYSAYTASVCGALSQLFMKVVSLAIHDATSVGAGAVLKEPAVFVALAGLVTCAPLQLYLLNSTLASSPVSYAVPVYQALLVMLTTAAGGIFFLEFEKTSVTGDLAYGFGGAAAIVGLMVLGKASSDGNAGTEENAGAPLWNAQTPPSGGENDGGSARPDSPAYLHTDYGTARASASANAV